MCTVTVFRNGCRTLLTMNRDERWDRAPEIEPRAVSGSNGGPSWFAPADGERGGTWIGANDRLVMACILNGYAPEDIALLGKAAVPSRGEIIPLLLARPSAEALDWTRDELDPTRYPSFTLVVLTPERGEELVWRLDSGVSRRYLGAGWSMITSSFWRADEVTRWRREQFRRWLIDGEELVNGVPRFHLLEVEGRREWSPFMTRPLSATRSITQIVSESERIAMRYWRRYESDPIDPDDVTTSLSIPVAASKPLRR